MELFEVLAARRKLIKMSFDDLSAASKIPVSTLKKILTGVTANPPFETVRAIAHAMGITTDDVSNAMVSQADLSLSPAALDVARRYDHMSETAQRLISAITLFESADMVVQNRILAMLVDHANEKVARESSLVLASEQPLAMFTSLVDE